VQKVHQVLDLVLLKNISESRHGRTTIVDLVFDLLLLQALANSAQIRPKISTTAIDAVAVLAPLLVKERCTSLFTVARRSVDNLKRRLARNTEKTRDKNTQAKSNQDSRRQFVMPFQRGRGFLAIHCRQHVLARLQAKTAD
jgi:hypothetical protein